MVAEEIMTRNPVSVAADAPLTDAIGVLHDLDVRHVPVLQHGQLVGMLSDRDLRAAQFATPSDGDGLSPAALLERPVSPFMSGGVVSVTPETELSEVIELMVDRKIGAIAVVDEHKSEMVGIVSYIDVLRAAAEFV